MAPDRSRRNTALGAVGGGTTAPRKEIGFEKQRWGAAGRLERAPGRGAQAKNAEACPRAVSS